MTEDYALIVEYIASNKFTPQTAKEIGITLNIPIMIVQGHLTSLVANGYIEFIVKNNQRIFKRTKKPMYPLIIRLIQKGLRW